MISESSVDRPWPEAFLICLSAPRPHFVTNYAGRSAFDGQRANLYVTSLQLTTGHRARLWALFIEGVLRLYELHTVVLCTFGPVCQRISLCRLIYLIRYV